jgi:hypothetical protein
MSLLTLPAAIAVVFSALFLVALVLPPRDPIAHLRRRYMELTRLSREEARTQLERRIEGLTVRFPGKTYSWYVQWLVRDLERAKD